jgi:putative Ig domain-containing protein
MKSLILSPSRIIFPLFLTLLVRGQVKAQQSLQLAAGEQGIPYAFTIGAQGDDFKSPLRWTIKSGKLPPGLVLERGPNDGQETITGTPSAAQAMAYEFVIEVSDSSQPPRIGDQSFSLVIKASPIKIVLISKVPNLRIIPENSLGHQDEEPTGSPADPNKSQAPSQSAIHSQPSPSAPLETTTPSSDGGKLPTKPAKDQTASDEIPESQDAPQPNPEDSNLKPTGQTEKGNANKTQQAGGICNDTASKLCLVQPLVGTILIKGRGTPGKIISATVDESSVGESVKVGSDNNFSIPIKTPLKEFQSISVSAVDVKTEETESVGPFPVKPADTCSTSATNMFCLDQPNEGEKKVTGKLAIDPTSKKVAADTSVDEVIVNEIAQGPADVNLDNGTFSKAVNALSQYDTVEATEEVKSAHVATAGPVLVGPAADKVSGQSLYTLGMAGLDITSTTTSSPGQQYSVEFIAAGPISKGGRCASGTTGSSSDDKSAGCDKDALDSRLWAWFNPRIASVPSAATASLSSLTSASTALSGLGTQTLSSLTQSLEVRGGLDFALLKPRSAVLFGEGHKAALGVSLIFGGGGVTPFNAETGAQEFDLTSASSPTDFTAIQQQFFSNTQLQTSYRTLFTAICPKYNTATSASACGAPTNSKLAHVAFVLPSRSRFLRSYFGGLRLKTFYFGPDCSGANIRSADPTLRCKPKDVFPGTLDFTFGQDETVTAGRLHRFVLTLAANYPFPGAPWLRIFGAAYFGLSANQNSPTLALPPTQTFVNLTDPSVIVQPVAPLDQDYFRIGLGFDIIEAYKSITGTSKTPAANQSQTQGSSGGASANKSQR